MLHPTRLKASIEQFEGQPLVIGPDEAEAANVPISISFDTELPGGFGPGTITLPIAEGVDETTVRLYAQIRIEDADTGSTYYIGRISAVNITSTQVQLSTEGMSKHLEDDETAHEIYYDRDLSHWEGPTIAREVYLKEGAHGGYAVVPASTETDIEAPALTNVVNGETVIGSLARSNGWYDGGACRIGEIDFVWKKNAGINSAETKWEWELFTATNSTTGAGGKTTGNMREAGPKASALTAGGERYACVDLRCTGAGGEKGNNAKIQWTLLGVVGIHGLPLQGTVALPDVGRGIFGSDAMAHAVGKFAPLLPFTTGTNGSIEPTSFAIPQLEFRDDTTVRAMVEQIALYGGEGYLPMDWGAYELFFSKAPGAYGRVWRVRKDETAESNDSGPDASERLNGVKVSYDDGTGKRFTVGPIGSGADSETTLLEDTDPTNPANQDGARHWKGFDAGVTSQSGAQLIGQLILNKANTIHWRGDVVVKGFALDANGAELPVALMRSGDRVVVEDEEDTRERRIVNTTYDGATQTASASCGAPPDYLDVLMARNAAVIQGRI